MQNFWDRFAEDLEKAEGEMESYKAGIPTDQKCEKCGQGILLERISRHRFFLGCSRYPDCDLILNKRPVADPSPECGALMLADGREQVSCTSCAWKGPAAEQERELASVGD